MADEKNQTEEWVKKELSYHRSVIDLWDPTGGLPVDPDVGDSYIATATGNGWVENSLYSWAGSSWKTLGVTTGVRVFVENQGVVYIYTGSIWKPEAIVAMGTKDSSNPLNHDIYTPTFGSGAGEECEGDDPRLSDDRDPTTHGNDKHTGTYVEQSDIDTSIGTHAGQAAVHHARYTDGEAAAVAAAGIAAHTAIPAAHHTKYTDPEAVTAMGVKDDGNPLNHDKAEIPKAGSVPFGDFAGNPKKATVTFNTAFPDANYAVGIIGVDGRSWTIESKVVASFVINSGSNIAPTGDTDWTATPHNDP